MDHFSLDSVRESFAADVAASIARAAEAARAILRALPPPPEGGRSEEFDAAAYAFHAIKGSSSLLAIGPLTECAAELEELAARGRAALELAAEQARVGRAAAEACLQGGLRLQELAQLALGHQDEALGSASRELRALLAQIMGVPAPDAAAPPPVAEPPLPAPAGVDLDAMFDFEDDPAPVTAPGPASPPSAADAAPFRAEARLLIESLLAGLEAARRNPGDEGPAVQIERTLEELEQGAQKAGWSGIAGVALSARNEVAAARCAEAGLDATLLTDLDERCHALLAVLGFPGTSVDTAEDAVPPEAGAELDSLFRDEARQACREAVLIAQGVADGGTDEPVTALGRLAHRLKGSAVLARHGAIEAAAEALQAACQARLDDAASSTDPIQEALLRLRVLLGDDETPSAAVRERVTMESDPAVWEGFEIESSETLASIEDAALKLEENLDPKAVLSDLFRYYHTLKGALHSVGLGPVARLVHRLEDLTEELLEAAILPPLARLASLLLSAQGRIRRALSDARTGFVVIDLASLERDLVALRSGGDIPSARGGSSPLDAPSSQRSGAPSHRSSPSTDSEDASARSVGDAVERRLVRVPRERLDAMMDLAGELLVSRSRLARRVARVRGLEQEMRGHGRRLVEAAEDFRERHEFRLAAGSRTRVAAAAAAGGGFSDLELDRYDEVNVLARTLGEAAARLTQTQGQLTGALSGIAEDAQGFGTVVAGLQGEVTRARMIALGQLFVRLRGPVRDAAEREGKQVRLVTSGDDVTLDKALVDELYTPLLHLVRNAVAHGIEAPAYRRGAGKDAIGTVRLSARQENTRVVVQVEDDGAGLDLPRLHRLAVEAGLLAPDVPVDAPEVAEVVFARGLSTRADVDDVSGRGIGGDVVHREVERLGGEIRVLTRSGAGTTFVLSLPMTLSITRSLWVQCGGETMALPLDFAQAIVDLSEAEQHDSAGVRRLRHGDGYVVLHSLAGLLGRPEGEGRGSAVVVHAGTQAMAFAVDRVVGQEEIFVKPLGDLLEGHPLFSGVTLGGDGELLPILDVRGLIQEARSERGAAQRAEPRARVRRARVLFVDDSLSVRRVGEKFLVEEGIDVTVAVDGEDALSRLRAEAFDLVFTDLEMPRLNGYDLIATIRSSPALRHLPVVVVTSRSGRKHREHAEAVGATDYLTKPFTAESLRQLVVRWTREGRS